MLGFETILPFLRPIEHLIRDDSISEIMVNGSAHVFIERAGVLQGLAKPHLEREIFDGRGQEHRPATWRRHLRAETDPGLPAA